MHALLQKSKKLCRCGKKLTVDLRQCDVCLEIIIFFLNSFCQFKLVSKQMLYRFYTAYVERSPHEIYLPSYGIGLKPEDEGSIWNNGIKLRTTSPEYPLHFTVGMTGCAFSILLNQYFKNGTEGGKVVLNYNSYGKCF